MATEIRRIQLSDEELQRMVAAFIKDPSLPYGGATLLDMEEAKSTPLEMMVTMHSDGGRQIRTLLGEVELIGSVLHFLRERNIPVSRKSKKSIKRSSDGAYIVFDMIQSIA